MKRCSENMQQIYRRTHMPKCNCNEVALQLYWNHISSWVFSCKLAAYFQNTISEEHLWRISYKKTDKPDHKWLRGTTSDYEWLRVTTSDYNWLWARLRVTTSDYTWLRVATSQTTSDYKWLRVIEWLQVRLRLKCRN